MESSVNTQAYGPCDGGYNTPFAVTVFYTETNIFQLAIAILSVQCQPIPVAGDLSLLGDACEHPSPDLILFSDSKYTPEHLQKYFKRGFQKIRIFAEKTTNEIEALSQIDSRISLFSLDNLHEGNFGLVNNLNAMYILELITSGVYPNYKSFISKVNNQNGVQFIRYLYRAFTSPAEIARMLIGLTLQVGGYERVEEMVQKAIGMEEERRFLARDRVQSSPLRDDVLYVMAADLRNEILRADYPKSARYVVLWHIRGDFKVSATAIKGPKWSESDTTPLEWIRQYTLQDGVLRDGLFIPFEKSNSEPSCNEKSQNNTAESEKSEVESPQNKSGEN